MQTAKFMIDFIKTKKDISYKDEAGWSWRTRMKLAELTQYIDYKCGFEDSDGKRCIDYPHSTACCISCYSAIGHIRTLPNDIKIISKIARLFVKPDSFKQPTKLGFWREGKGCVLPRKYRSKICLRHHCTSLSDPARKLIFVLGMDSKELRKTIIKETSYNENDFDINFRWNTVVDAYVILLKKELVEKG
jgi:hypothetical protein